jgi:hypothetical protein
MADQARANLAAAGVVDAIKAMLGDTGYTVADPVLPSLALGG